MRTQPRNSSSAPRIAIALLLLGLYAMSTYGNESIPAACRSEAVTFRSGDSRLAGELCLPPGSGPFPAVAYVAGSGPAGRDGYGILPAHWESFARRGVASLAWDKPGVGQSTGDWRTQTNENRAREAIAAVQFLKERKDIEESKIGLWGISQAGWILPIAYSLSPKDVAFIISVSAPVGTGAEQELYRVAHGLPADGFSASDTKEAVDFTRKRLALMKRGAPFEAVAELQSEVETESWFAPLGKLDERSYEFLRSNAFYSPRALLERITCPVLAVFGDKDTIVDFKESARVYAESLRKAGNRDVSIRIFPDADHVMFPSETGGAKELERSMQLQIKVFAPGYLDAMAAWLAERFVTEAPP